MPASALLAAASVASLNLCTDEYLLLLARPQEIASVSFLSRDPQESPLWRQALGLHSNRGSLEDVIGRKPHIVLTMGGGGQTIGVPSVGADWLRLAGLKQRRLTGDRVSLETLLVRPPKVLVQSRYRSGQVSRGIEWLNHPIVRNAKARSLQADGRAWTCMGPLVIPEIERLRSSLR